MDTAPQSGELIAITMVLYVLTEVVKSSVGITGNQNKVRLVVLLLAVVLSVVEALFGVKGIPPGGFMAQITPNLIWEAFKQGILLAGAALGIHAATRSGNGGTGLLGGGVSLEAVSERVSEANHQATRVQNAADQMKGALEGAQDAVTIASRDKPLAAEETKQETPDATFADNVNKPAQNGDYKPLPVSNLEEEPVLAYSREEAEQERLKLHQP